MNRFEVKLIVNELENLKSFSEMALRVFAELREENELLNEIVAGKGDRPRSTITVKEISEDMGVSTATVIRWIMMGKIKGRKEGNRWVVLYKDYVRYRESA